MLYPEVPQELSSTVPGSLGVEPFGINIRTGAGQVEFLYIFSILSLLLSTSGRNFSFFRRFPSSVRDSGLTRNNRRKGRRSLIARAASAGAPQDLSSAETEIYADGAAQPIVPSRFSV